MWRLSLISGEIALVTGAARAIGAIARCVATAGAYVVVNDLDCAAAVYLASPAAQHTTGITLDVNGGQIVK